MKLKYEFAVSQVCGVWAAVAVGESCNYFHGVISLNETGADIMKLLVDDITEDELVSKMLEIYDVSEQQMRKDVADFIVELKKQNVLI